MNIVINQFDNLIVCEKTYECVPPEYKKLLNFDGLIVGVSAYDALMRNLKMVFDSNDGG